MKLIFELVANDVNVATELAKQRDALKAINKELKKVEDGSEGQKLLRQAAVNAKLAINDLTEQQKKLNAELKALKVPTDSLAGLRLQYSKLSVEISKLDEVQRKSILGQSLIKNAANLKKQIDGIEQSIGRFTGNVGNYKSAFDGVFGALGVTAAIGAVTGAFAKFNDVNAKTSDGIADVAKAADASIPEIQALADLLEQRNTRTSLVDQLGIAEIGGKLGVAKAELFDFTESVDTLNVALGDQFGGSAEQTTEVVGKLRNVLTDIKSEKISEDILRIGNALNFLEAQGASSASATADFAGRIAGAAQPLGVTSNKIIGLSATLDELGINAERGSTASVRLLQRLATAPEAFAAAIDEPAQDFKQLVNDDIFGALQLFITKLNSKELSNTALSQTLKTLDVDGAGVSEVVGKLGENMDLLSKRVTQAGTALGNTDSITQEFQKKNATFGASIDKLSNSFNALFTNSRLSSSLGDAINLLAEFVGGVAVATDKIFNLSGKTTGLSAANEILSTSLEDANKQLAVETINTEKNFNVLKNDKASRDQRNQAISNLLKIYPDVLTQQELEKASIGQLTVLQKDLTNTLRDQVIERSKIQAKAAIEQEILDRKVRQVQLDATPDRAFVRELTFGEVARVAKDVGLIEVDEIQAARKSLKSQVEGDIAALENKLKQVDANFTAITNNRENNLSDIEQDELDRRRQFADSNRVIAKTQKDIIANNDGLSKSEIKVKKERDAAIGSIDFLEKKVSDLKASLEAAKPDQIPKILGNLVEAEKELKTLQDSIDRLRAAPLTDQQQIEAGSKQAAVELGVPDEAKIKELTDAQREAAVEFSQFDIETTAETEEIKNQLIRAANQQKIELTKEQVDAQLKIEEEAEKRKQEIREAFINAAFDSAIALTQSIANEQARKVDDEKDKELSALDEEYEKKRELAQGNAQALEAIDKEYATKKDEIEKEAARERKRIALIESIIAGALATVKALPNVPLVIATGIGAAVQSAIIARQKFAVGGFTGKGAYVDETGERVVDAKLHEDEYVAPRSQVQMFPSLFKELDRLRTKRGASTGTGYATGGFSTAPGISLSTSQSRAQSSLNIEAKASIDKESVYFIAEQVAKETYAAIAQGLNDADRTNERKQQLIQLTEI
jgi:TP901 family phage tail tape measure protein